MAGEGILPGEKMKLTRAQIAATLRPGDVVLVHYLKGGFVAAGIQFVSGGSASHALCCLGDLEVVEADLGGVMHTYVDNYMTGKCRLTVKRLRAAPDAAEVSKIVKFWRSKISDPYDIGMIFHVAAGFPIRRLLLPLCPPLGRLLLRLMGRFSFASHTLSTCAELAARGLREARPRFLHGYDQEDITPEVLLRDAASLETIVVWDAPLLAGDQ